MITQLTEETLPLVHSPALAAYARRYVDIHAGFMKQVRSTGIEIDPHDYTEETEARLRGLAAAGAILRNDEKSVYVNSISPACVACQTGVGSVTFFISLRCHRSCFYCFNPNQERYEHYCSHQRDLVKELDGHAAAKHKIAYMALTGGEPLLHPDEAIAFFAHAGETYPEAHKRLYTCGDYADEAVLQRLASAGLQEIRFSIRMSDKEQGHRLTLQRIELAKRYIPYVMVEMPIWPDTGDTMRPLLRELDRLEIESINLLELCYPLVDPQPFKERGFKVKRRPFRVLYDYWYAGTLPIARSELLCLELLQFALDEGLRMGVHYCSLENKHTGQLYQQNAGRRLPKTHFFSEKDYLLKSAKAFGGDALHVLAVLERSPGSRYVWNREHRFVEFHVGDIARLAGMDVELGLSSSVLEKRADGEYMRELQVDLTTPATFDAARDV